MSLLGFRIDSIWNSNLSHNVFHCEQIISDFQLSRTDIKADEPQISMTSLICVQVCVCVCVCVCCMLIVCQNAESPRRNSDDLAAACVAAITDVAVRSVSPTSSATSTAFCTRLLQMVHWYTLAIYRRVIGQGSRMSTVTPTPYHKMTLSANRSAVKRLGQFHPNSVVECCVAYNIERVQDASSATLDRV